MREEEKRFTIIGYFSDISNLKRSMGITDYFIRITFFASKTFVASIVFALLALLLWNIKL